MSPNRQYAYVVRRTLRDAEGDRIRISPTVRQLAEGGIPSGALGAEVRDRYQPLWNTLDELGINHQSMATATVLTSALPLNPERFPIPLSDAYLNPVNLGAYLYTFRQGVFEQRLLLEALKQLEIAPEVLANCLGVALPSGETRFRLQTSSIVALDQSHGAYRIEHLYPGLRLLKTAWEPANPIAYVPRIAQRPLPNQPVRSIYQPVAEGDTQFPESVFNTMALAGGVEQAGEIVWDEMQQSLALADRAGIVPYPVVENVESETGLPYTGVVVQYEGDGIADPHTIFSQLDAVKYQYRCFFQSAQETGTAIVPAPQDLTTPCPIAPRQ